MQYDLSDSKESDSKEQIILSCNFDYNDRHDLIQAAKATKLASTGVVQPGLLMLIHEKTSKSSSATYPEFPHHNDQILFVQRTSGVWRTDHVDGLLPFQRPASNHDEDHRAAAARGMHIVSSGHGARDRGYSGTGRFQTRILVLHRLGHQCEAGQKAAGFQSTYGIGISSVLF